MTKKPGQFHSHDGWTWERLPDDSVRVTAADGSKHDLAASAWASIVSHVSERGETGETQAAALAFHNEP